MVLTDVNVLVYAFRPDATDHERYRDWLQDLVDGPEAFGCSDIVLSGFLRVVTHPRVFASPDSLDAATAFASAVRDHPYLAALAIEAGCEWVTTDRDFARFPGWRHPLQ